MRKPFEMDLPRNAKFFRQYFLSETSLQTNMYKILYIHPLQNNKQSKLDNFTD